MSDPKDNKGKAPQIEDPEAGSSADKKSKDAGGAASITPKMAEKLLENNPALKNELAGMDKKEAAEALRKMTISELLTGLSVGGKNQKDMASYRFWQTQPVPRFDEAGNATGGPIKMIDPEKVSKEPDQLIEGFEWATLDLTNETELRELWDLLTYHYVEDDNAMFRFRYSESFLHWYVSFISFFI
jgi:glycylpeptide N-tetradecanoyltransferase